MSCWLVPRVAGHAGVVLGGKRRLALRKGLARRAAGLRPHRDVRLPGWNGPEAELPRFAQSSNLVSGHRPPEPLQLRLANRSGVNGVLNRCVYAWSEEDLRSPGSGAEPRVQVGYGSREHRSRSDPRSRSDRASRAPPRCRCQGRARCHAFATVALARRTARGPHREAHGLQFMVGNPQRCSSFWTHERWARGTASAEDSASAHGL